MCFVHSRFEVIVFLPAHITQATLSQDALARYFSLTLLTVPSDGSMFPFRLYGSDNLMRGVRACLLQRRL
jgi:hypothetical protein